MKGRPQILRSAKSFRALRYILNLLYTRAPSLPAGPHFLGSVVEHEGWVWRNEGLHPMRPKFGYISDKPGMVGAVS